MKHTLTLYADVPSTDGAFLLEVAIALGAYRLRPEALTWSLSGMHKVKVGIVIAGDYERHVPELLERFRSLHCVTQVEIQTPPAPDAHPISD